MQINEDVGNLKVMAFEIIGDGILRYHARLYMTDLDGLQDRIFNKANTSRYVVYPGFTKMYHALRRFTSGIL